MVSGPHRRRHRKVYLASPGKKLLLVIAAFLVFVGLAYFSICSAIAAHYSEEKTQRALERAVRIEPENAEYWYLLGNHWQYDLDHPDAERAIRAYRTALTLDPHSANTWLELASIYESKGAFDRARQAYTKARDAYPVSARVSWRFGNFLIRMGEQESSFRELRRAVEEDPQLGWAAFAILRRYRPDIEGILDSALPRDPSVYLDLIWNLTTEGNPESASKVWARLLKIENPETRQSIPQGHYQSTQRVLFSLVNGLITAKSLTTANRVWHEALTFMQLRPLHDPQNSVIWDGGFESDVSGGGFAWRFDAPQGSRIFVDTQIKHSGNRSVRVTFAGGQNTGFYGVCQFVSVKPETVYDVSVWLRTAGLTSDSGVFFGLEVPGSGKYEAITPELLGTHPWTQFSLKWKAEPGIELLKVCLARTPSRTFDRNIAGSVWIDEVKMVPENSR